MVLDISGFIPFIVVFAVLAGIGTIVSLGVLADAVVRHHRTRVASHQSIPTYYRRLVLAH